MYRLFVDDVRGGYYTRDTYPTRKEAEHVAHRLQLSDHEKSIKVVYGGSKDES